MKQHRIHILSLLFGSMLLFTCCDPKKSSGVTASQDPNQELSGENAEERSDQRDQVLQGTMSDMSNIQDRTFQTLVTFYLDLNKAMVASDAKAAKSIASRLLTTLANLDPENDLEAVKAEVKNILDSDDIKQQRVHFAPLSEQFYQLVKVNQGQRITLYKQYCPMALDGKGAFWISDSKEIENPYYGASMLNCGTVKETLTVNN